jgi:hypothetical protein
MVGSFVLVEGFLFPKEPSAKDQFADLMQNLLEF